MDQRFAYSPADLAKVKVVQFSIMSPEEIVRSIFLVFKLRSLSNVDTTVIALFFGCQECTLKASISYGSMYAMAPLTIHKKKGI